MSGTRLVGDVGGTNARFALLDGENQPVSSSTLSASDFPSLAEAVRSYLDRHDVDRLDAAAVAVATPVTGDAVKLTNNHWSFSIEQTRRDLGLQTLHVINDFTALALSVPHLPESELIRIGGGEQLAKHARAVIGPGTGLGVSGLVPCGSHWSALQGEGGHVSLGVRTPREIAVYRLLTERFGHVSAERFLSGPGLVNVVTALRQIDGLSRQDYSPAQVTEYGMTVADDSEHGSCVEALNMFCDLLGSCAGNLVLTLGAEGGVYIGGGIVPRLGDFFARSGFRQQFEDKGRMQGYLQKVPSYVIHSPYPALIGAAQLII